MPTSTHAHTQTQTNNNKQHNKTHTTNGQAPTHIPREDVNDTHIIRPCSNRSYVHQLTHTDLHQRSARLEVPAQRMSHMQVLLDEAVLEQGPAAGLPHLILSLLPLVPPANASTSMPGYLHIKRNTRVSTCALHTRSPCVPLAQTIAQRNFQTIVTRASSLFPSFNTPSSREKVPRKITSRKLYNVSLHSCNVNDSSISML